MSHLPAYSVIIPAYNATAFIAETIGSVVAQTHLPEKIIVVDDGSTDDLSATLASIEGPITLIRQSNSGPGSATSAGVGHAETPFIAMLDADDLWLPDKIEQQCLALEPATEMIFTRMTTFGDDVGTAEANDAHSGWSRSTLLMRRATFQAIGPIEDMPGYRGEMVNWFAKARTLNIPMKMLEAPLAKRRIHPGSLSRGHSGDQDKGYMEVVLRAMRRRKAQEP